MRTWISEKSTKLLASVFGAMAPGIIAQLLAKIDPETIAVRVRPHMEAMIVSLPPNLRDVYIQALQKLLDIAEACVATLKKEKGGKK